MFESLINEEAPQVAAKPELPAIAVSKVKRSARPRRFCSPVNQIDPTQIDSDGEDEQQFGRESELISENMKATGGDPSESDSPIKLRQTMEFNPTFRSIGNSKNTAGQQDSVRIKSQTGGAGSHLDPFAYQKSSTVFGRDMHGRQGPFSLVAVGTQNPEDARRAPQSTKGEVSLQAQEYARRQAADGDQIEVDIASLGQDRLHFKGQAGSPKSQPFSPFNIKSEHREEEPTTAEPSNAFGSMLDEPDTDSRLPSKTLIDIHRLPAEMDAGDFIPEDYVPRRRRCLTGFEFRSVLSEKYNELKETHGNDPYFYRNLKFEDQFLKPNAKPPISKISDAILKDFFLRFAKSGSIDASHFPKLIEEIYQFEKRPTPNYLQCLYLMSKYDTNKDGKIDFGEFKAMMAEL